MIGASTLVVAQSVILVLFAGLLLLTLWWLYQSIRGRREILQFDALRKELFAEHWSWVDETRPADERTPVYIAWARDERERAAAIEARLNVEVATRVRTPSWVFGPKIPPIP